MILLENEMMVFKEYLKFKRLKLHV